MKARDVEKKGLEALQSNVRQRKAALRRPECLRKHRKKKEQSRAAFYKDPYKFAKSLFCKEKTGTLKVPLRELEEHLKNTYPTNPTTNASDRHKDPYMEWSGKHG